ncbi:MAG: hypothetical protein H6Q90_5924 [Deltaproteobacteria bacterium]|nr:hypothetical protein [Deltaproteobacteria bacterium]
MCGAGSFKVGDNVLIEIAASAHRLGLRGRIIWNDHGRRRHAGVEFDRLDPRVQTALNGALFEDTGPVAKQGSVLLAIADPTALSQLGEVICEAGLGVVTRLTPLDFIQALESRGDVVAAIVSADLPCEAAGDLLAYLASDHPSIPRILLLADEDGGATVDDRAQVCLRATCSPAEILAAVHHGAS